MKNLDEWLVYFQNNIQNNDCINWDIKEQLSTEDYNCIKKSIATFQLGESSEGKNLIKSAEKYAYQENIEYLSEITKLFIKEEQSHSVLLKKFMLKHHIPVIRKNWTDAIFRKLRKNVTYEVSVTVLITAEIIALSYYQCLGHSTNSRLLAHICDQIIQEETFHVQYGSEVLACIREDKTAFQQLWTYVLHSLLFLGFSIAIYVDHRSVISRGGYTPTKFLASCWTDYWHYITKPRLSQSPKSSLEKRPIV